MTQQRKEPQAFIHKPTSRTAIQWDGTNTAAIVDWVGNKKVIWYATDGDLEWLSIETLEGRMRANIWDWIVKGTSGEFYPVKPAIFADNYVEAGRSSLESENAELRKLLRNLLAADGHSLTPQCSFTGCNCGGVEKYKVARSEAVGAIRGGTNVQE